MQNSSLHLVASAATPSTIPSVFPSENNLCEVPFMFTPASTPTIQCTQKVEESSSCMGHHADAFTAHANKAARADDAHVDEEQELNLWAAAAAVQTFPSGMDTWMFSPHQHKAFNVLRKGMLKWYNWNSRQSCVCYLVQTYGTIWPTLRSEPLSKQYHSTTSRPTQNDKIIIELRTDLAIGSEALTHAGLSSFMDWTGGSSTLYFWRSPSDYQKKACNGSDVFLSGTLPSYWDQQRHPKDFTKQQQMRQKLAKIEMKWH